MNRIGKKLPLLACLFAIGLAPVAEARKKDRHGWHEQWENRRDARRAGVIAGAVASGIASSAAKSNANRDYDECMRNIAAYGYGGDAAYRDPGRTYYSQQAGYSCEIQRYEARADARRAAHRTGVVAGAVAYGIVRD